MDKINSEQPGKRNENTDDPKPATVPTISEKNAIKKNGKTNIVPLCKLS